MIRNEELEAVLETIDLRNDAPIEEPMRQYYFIKKAREIVNAESEKLGKRLTADGETFGCQMNAKDSEKLIGILENIGFEMIDDESADLVFYNTCTVRDNANQRVYGRLGLIHSMKKRIPTKSSTLRLYDAGTDCDRKNTEKLSVCGFGIWNAQYLQICRAHCINVQF